MLRLFFLNPNYDNMKSLFLICLSLAIFSYSHSQKIKKDEVDKFTKQRRIETSISYVRQSLGCVLGFSYRSVDSTCFINVHGSGCATGVIGKDDKFILLLKDSSVIEITSTGVQDYE